MLLLVLPVLPSGSGGGGAGGDCKPVGRMGNVASRIAADLLGISILSSVFGTVGSGKRAGGNREAACRTDRVAQHENDRSAGAGDRGQGSHDPHASAAGADL